MDEPRVIYEDENLVAVYKPPGLVMHPAKGKTGGLTLADWLIRRYPEMKRLNPERGGIVHRLDRETSGVVLAARNAAYLNYLQTLFRERQVLKIYRAIVFGVPKKKRGRINKPIGIKSGTIKRSVHSLKAIKSAVTDYEIRRAFERDGEMYSLLEVRPSTGRTHQIRVHLASVGHPLVGDPLYGRKRQPSWATRLMLHALALEFNLASGRRIRIEAEPPPELAG